MKIFYMKNFARILLLVSFFLLERNQLFSQSTKSISAANIADSANPKKQSENIIRTANDLKTGNWQDVLSSFLQLSFSDLTGPNKALNFKTTLLALKIKADSSLLIDSNYKREQFARNFQFDFSLNLDSQYKFKGFQGGFTWAIINKRDSSVLSLAHTLVDSLFLVGQTDIQNAFIAFQKSVSDSTGHILPDKKQLFATVKQKIQDNLRANGFTETKDFPAEFKPFLKKTYDENIRKANDLFNKELAKMRTKPLLTLSVNSTFKNDQQAFHNGQAQLIYLQGIKTARSSTEIDLRVSANIRDTTLVTTQRRADLKASGGINFSLIKTNTQKSILEFKPYFEYFAVLTTPIGDEKKNKFSANADLRLRITDNLWLPLVISYDIDKKNFLGFLNVDFNFNAFKKQK
jgi:hypothetical protein